jgi:Na+-driven multidrug efflux pump
VLIPRFGTQGAAFGTVGSAVAVAAYGLWKLFRQDSVIRFHRGMDLSPDFAIIRSLFRFGLPAGCRGRATRAARSTSRS